METVLRELNARLDELEANLVFVASATTLRPRLGGVLNWQVGGEVVRLAQNYLNAAASRPENLYAALLVRAIAAFERFCRQLVENATVRTGVRSAQYEDLAKHIRERNVVLTGRLLASLDEPRDHLTFDPTTLAQNLASCTPGSASFRLNAAAFAAVVVSGRPLVLERALRNLDVENWRDAVGGTPGLQRLLATAGARATGHAVYQRLEELCRWRNIIAHAGDSEPVVNEEDLHDAIEFLRALAAALGQVVLARLR
jgi:hypothetical protein